MMMVPRKLLQVSHVLQLLHHLLLLGLSAGSLLLWQLLGCLGYPVDSNARKLRHAGYSLIS